MSIFSSGVTEMELGWSQIKSLGLSRAISKSTAASRESCLGAHFTDEETETENSPPSLSHTIIPPEIRTGL